MLTFHSANVRIANSERAVDECLEIAFGGELPKDCRLIICNATLGHRLDRVAAALAKQLPGVTMLGSSCAGVIGRAGVGESMNELAIMAVCGPETECAFSTVAEIYGSNSLVKAGELAEDLKKKSPAAKAIYLLCPGIDIANDLVLEAITKVFGEAIPIFGGTSADNMRGFVSYQYDGKAVTEHSAWAVAFADPGLSALTKATHGFTAYGEPLLVTKAEGNKILELNGRPAWQEYTSRLGLEASEGLTCGQTIPVGALAEELPPALAEEYGNAHILRVVTKFDKDGAMYYPTSCREGMRLWLTMRDEELIFSEQQRALDFLNKKVAGRRPVAVFQTDCLARGRFLFNKVIKDEIIAMIQGALSDQTSVPPWLGMYGFGEYTILGGRNAYHNYSTALLVLYR